MKMSTADSLTIPHPIQPAKSHWFSDNPEKAWVEKTFLIYSPVWMVMMGLMMITGWDKTFSNTALLVHGLLVALPVLFVPMLLHHKHSTVPWHQSYWFKANLYLFSFGFFGNYIGSEYFFDVLGMVYHYPNATTTLDAMLVGQGDQPVPVIMYLYTHAYFMTYHTTAVLLLRRVVSSGIPFTHLSLIPLALAVGFAWAWLETKAMANPLMATSFYYTNMPAMLKFGSLIYATYFVVSFPIYYYLDENPAAPWDIFKVAAASLSASMLVFYLLDLCAHWVGTL